MAAGPAQKIRKATMGVPTVIQWVKDPALLQLWLRFDPWPRNFHILQVWLKNKERKKEKKEILRVDPSDLRGCEIHKARCWGWGVPPWLLLMAPSDPSIFAPPLV